MYFGASNKTVERRSHMEKSKDRCWVEINLETIKENYTEYSKQLQHGQRIMAVVKADAYGHGDKEVAAVLQDVGC